MTGAMLYYHAWKLGTISCSSLYISNHLHSLCNMDSINSHWIKLSSLLYHQTANISLLHLWSVQHILNNEWKMCLPNNSLSSKNPKLLQRRNEPFKCRTQLCGDDPFCPAPTFHPLNERDWLKKYSPTMFKGFIQMLIKAFFLTVFLSVYPHILLGDFSNLEAFLPILQTVSVFGTKRVLLVCVSKKYSHHWSITFNVNLYIYIYICKNDR